ncbi:MAG: DNA-processing protein DprA [Acidimicrobiales bacterium]
MTEPDGRTLGFAILLAGRPKVGPRRLAELLAGPGAEAAWREVGGDAGADPEATYARHRDAGVHVLVPGDGRYPDALAQDQEHPALLFAQGDLGALGDARVAIVGTRRCTGAGAGIARELGRELTDAGVTVVSGLALGIDGAAHRGVLEAGGRPVGVVGSGLDVVYPSKHRDLWARVAHDGVLLSEAPLGARPEPWRFPARNRIIAALAHLVVVVESHAAGGAMLTVKEAADRDVPVMAVPGSIRSASSAGTNQLIAEGCAPVLDATDVMVALGLTAASRAVAADARRPPPPAGKVVLEAFDWEPVTLEHLATRTGMRLPDLAVALEELLAGGWVTVAGGWYERASS